MEKCYPGHEWCSDYPADRKDGEKHYCVFHAPILHKGISVEKFNKLVLQRLDNALKKNELCDLDGTIFHEYIYFSFGSLMLPSVSFQSAEFGYNADFSGITFGDNADFGDATFGEIANFGQARFGKKVDFSRVKFGKNALFYYANFGKSTDFNEATFGENAKFNNSVFGEDADFNDVEFGEIAEFLGTEFGEVVSFAGTKFGAITDFTKAKFGTIANFDEAKFGENAYFRETEFKGDVYLGAKFKKAQFIGRTFMDVETVIADFNGLTADDEVRFIGVDFRRVRFSNAEMHRMRFERCKWNPPTNGRIIIRDELELTKGNGDETCLETDKWNDPSDDHIIIRDEEELSQDSDEEKIKQVEETYRALKQRYKEMHNEGEAGLFHASEKEMLNKRTSLRTFDGLILKSYRWTSGYGENPSRAFLILALFVVASMFGLWCAGLKDSNNVPGTFPQTILTTLEFLTFQRETHYGLKTATGLAGAIRVISSILVYIQALLFVFALRNRMRR